MKFDLSGHYTGSLLHLYVNKQLGSTSKGDRSLQGIGISKLNEATGFGVVKHREPSWKFDSVEDQGNRLRESEESPTYYRSIP